MSSISDVTKRSAGLWVLLAAVCFLVAGCGESFLEPEPKSFLSPSNTYTKKGGLEGLLNGRRNTEAREWYGDQSNMLTEYLYTDVGLPVDSRAGRSPTDVSVISPTNNDFGRTSFGDYWNFWYNNLSYANTIISSIDRVTDWSSEEERSAYLAEGYFHQAYSYYRLVNQFGDVPVYLSQIEEPRTNFNSYSREAILKQMRDHLEWAVQWLPQDVPDGQVNRAAGYHLLTKIYLQLRQFEDAIDAASQVIDSGNYALMRERFGNGRYADDPRFNVMWDLFEKENIAASGENTEGIYVTQDFYQVQGSPGRTEWMRSLTPRWWTMEGFIDSGALVDTAGRGTSFGRSSPYYVNEIWKDREDDYRRDESNWFAREEYYFNNEDYLRTNGFEDLIGKPATKERLERVGSLELTIPREWFSWQYNKLYVPDEEEPNTPDGGHTPWYIFRLAGTYLLRAEAYYWNGQPGQAAADINEVRERSNADPVDAGEVDIGYIFSERARELWWEEPRKTEMTRVSYIMAQLGRDGYSMSNMAETNWWYDRSIAKNDYYGENRTVRGFTETTYNLVPGFVYWPVPQDEIDSSTDGTINQWRAYQGSEDNIEPKGYEAIQELPGANAHEELGSIGE